MAIYIGSSRNMKEDLALHAANQLYYGTNSVGIVDTILGISRVDRACRKSSQDL